MCKEKFKKYYFLALFIIFITAGYKILEPFVPEKYRLAVIVLYFFLLIFATSRHFSKDELFDGETVQNRQSDNLILLLLTLILATLPKMNPLLIFFIGVCVPLIILLIVVFRKSPKK